MKGRARRGLRSRWVAVVSVCAVSVGLSVVAPGPAFAVTVSAPSSIDGGGVQNVIAVPPAGNTTYVDHA